MRTLEYDPRPDPETEEEEEEEEDITDDEADEATNEEVSDFPHSSMFLIMTQRHCNR